MSEVQSLTSRVQELERSASAWNNRYLTLVAVTVVVAAVLFIVQFIKNRYSVKLNAAQSELARAKDEQLTRDLKEKDIEIGRAKEAAAKAGEEAGKAIRRAEELRAQNLATEAKLEDERRTRLELEKSLAPRTLVLRVEGETSNIDSLRPFGGMNVILEALPDAEAERAAGYIEWILTQAKWKIVSKSRNPDLNQGEYDGVVIQHRIYPGLMTPESAADRSQAAAAALLEFLKSSNWEAETISLFPRHHDKMPASTIRIMVGFKPSPYFLPLEIKKMREGMERESKQLFWERNKPPPPEQE